METWKPLIPRQEQQENHRDGAKIPGLIPAPSSPEELPGAVGYFRGHAFIPLYFYPHVTHTARGMTHPRRIQSPELKPRSSAHIPGARGGIRRRMEKTWEEDPAPHPWSGVGTSSRPFSVQNPARERIIHPKILGKWGFGDGLAKVFIQRSLIQRFVGAVVVSPSRQLRLWIRCPRILLHRHLPTPSQQPLSRSSHGMEPPAPPSPNPAPPLELWERWGPPCPILSPPVPSRPILSPPVPSSPGVKAPKSQLFPRKSPPRAARFFWKSWDFCEPCSGRVGSAEFSRPSPSRWSR